jgi:hypothetical protein
VETVSHKQLIFESLFSKEFITDSNGGRITSKVGGLLMRGWISATGSLKKRLMSS